MNGGRWIRPAATAAYALVVCAVCARECASRPDLFEPPPAVRAPEADAISIVAPGADSNPAATAVASALYRENPRRDGDASATAIALPLEPKWTTPAFNVGVHSASKSSPVADDSGIYVGADSGWFYAFGFDGAARWRFFAGHAARGIHGTAALDAERVYVGAYNGRFYALRKSDGALQWTARLGDAIGTAPLLLNGALYVSYETGRGRNGRLAKLDPRDGHALWTTEWMGEQVHSSPAYHAASGALIFGDNSGRLAAFHAETGQRLWTFRAGGAIKGTPAIRGDAVYAASWDKSFYALRAATGQLIWRAQLPGRSQSSATIVDAGAAGERAVLLADDGPRGEAMVAVSLKDGSIAWTRRAAGPSRAIGSGAAVRAQVGPRDAVAAVALPCEGRGLCVVDPRDGRDLQRLPLPGALTGVPWLRGGSVYVALDQGGLVRFDSVAAKTGPARRAGSVAKSKGPPPRTEEKAP